MKLQNDSNRSVSQEPIKQMGFNMTQHPTQKSLKSRLQSGIIDSEPENDLKNRSNFMNDIQMIKVYLKSPYKVLTIDQIK